MALALSASAAQAAAPRKRTKSATTKTVKAKKPKKGAKTQGTFEAPEAFPETPAQAEGDEPGASDTPVATPKPSGTPGAKPALTPTKPAAPATATTDPAPAKTEPANPAAPAWAGSVAVFAVARTPASADVAVQLQEELSTHLSARRDVQLVDLAEAFPSPAPASLREGDKLFEEGKAAYDNLDPESAAPKFQAAADFYTQHPAEMEPSRLARAYIFLGASQLLNNDKEGARLAFVRAIAADASQAPDINLFGGDVQQAFGAAQEEFKKRSAGSLTVESVPAGAKVLVRGKEVGVTPLKDLAVPAGRHAIVITRPGYAPYAMFQEVDGSKPAEVKAELEPAPGLAPLLDAARQASTERAFEGDVMPAEAGAIADRLGARYVVLAAVSRDRKGRTRAEVQAWDTRNKTRLRDVTIVPGSKDRDETAVFAANRVYTFITGAGETSGSGVASSSFLKKPWFWAAVGGAAVVTAGAVYYFNQDDGPAIGPISGTPGFSF
jgi:hypothetical protein